MRRPRGGGRAGRGDPSLATLRPMRIGVVSDTHNHLPNVARIVELLNPARRRARGAHRRHHAGRRRSRCWRASTRRCSASSATTTRRARGARGGGGAPRHRRSPIRRSSSIWAGRRIVVVHDPRDLDAPSAREHDVALHGHTHRRDDRAPRRAAGLQPGRVRRPRRRAQRGRGRSIWRQLETEILLF